VPVDLLESYVVLGIQREKVLIECIDTKAYTDDPQFFRELRLRNASVRGPARHYLSIWQLDHCHFVKVSIMCFSSFPCEDLSRD